MPTKTQISPYAKEINGEEAYFAKWIFSKKRFSITFAETIKQLRGPLHLTNWLIRSEDQDKAESITLTVKEYADLKKQFYHEQERFSYEELELMFIEAEAQRMYEAWRFKRMYEHRDKLPAWDELEECQRDGYREEAKERLYPDFRE